MIRKLLINDGRTEREVVLVGSVVVGRDPACHISEADPLLSRRHAEFSVAADAVTLRDLGSRNGMLVNGAKVPQHVMTSGDVVQLGHLQFLYVEEAPAPTPVAAAPAPPPVETETDEPTMAPVASRPPTAIDFDDTKSEASPVAADDEDDDEMTRVAAAKDLDATFLPSADPDATFAPSAAATMAPVGRARPALDTSIVAGPDLVVTRAGQGFRELLGIHPDSMIGDPLAEVLERTLASLAAGNGPPALSLVAVRNADRTVTVTFKAGQAVETV